MDATGRKQAEEANELLAGEMSPRVKKLLAVASGLTNMTWRSALSAEDMARGLTKRLTALGRAHDLVRPVAGNTEGALLGDLLTILLASYDDMGAFSGRIRVSVPRMSVGERAATTLAMVIHELAANSVKYGALSYDAGTLDVSCAPHETEVLIVWTERGSPAVTQPTKLDGFGSRPVSRIMSSQLSGSIDYNWSEDGLIAKARMCKDRMAT